MDGASDEIVAFLRQPASYPMPAPVEMIETHMSLVFLVGDFVYKMKKAVRLTFADFTALDSRRLNCERELVVNQRLAPGVYLSVIPVVRTPDGELALGGAGQALEWLIVMRRLDRARLLDALISTRSVQPSDIDRLGALLTGFYRDTPTIREDGPALHRRWDAAVSGVRNSLLDFHKLLPARSLETALATLERFLAEERPSLEGRIHQGRLVDGHGDLRPEHVFIGRAIMLIDRLEFDARLRWVDPMDEAMFLGLECERLGAGWIGPALVASLKTGLGDDPSPALLRFYRCYRGCLRASLSIEHLRDAHPRTPERWPVQAGEYLQLAVTMPPTAR